MDDIIEGHFSATMMEDWANDDANLLKWREETAESSFEKAADCDIEITEQEYYDKGIFVVAMVKAGVELAFEAMVAAGIIEESAYYESLHETPLIANCIARNKLYEMNVVISDTAEYGNYLFTHAAQPLLADYVSKLSLETLGEGLKENSNGVDNIRLIEVNEAIRSHGVESVGKKKNYFETRSLPRTFILQSIQHIYLTSPVSWSWSKCLCLDFKYLHPQIQQWVCFI
jgi:ketol-acid reductoisomerase